MPGGGRRCARVSVDDGSSVTEHVRRDTLISLALARDNTRAPHRVEDISIMPTTPLAFLFFPVFRVSLRWPFLSFSSSFAGSQEALLYERDADGNGGYGRGQKGTQTPVSTDHPRRKSASAGGG